MAVVAETEILSLLAAIPSMSIMSGFMYCSKPDTISVTFLKLTGNRTALTQSLKLSQDAASAATSHDRFLSRPPNGSNPVISTDIIKALSIVN